MANDPFNVSSMEICLLDRVSNIFLSFQHPFFMDSFEVDPNQPLTPELEALQALKYESENPLGTLYDLIISILTLNELFAALYRKRTVLSRRGKPPFQKERLPESASGVHCWPAVELRRFRHASSLVS